ncbi:MAG: tagaturonate epimerase family protein [Christensenellales bacterium]
MNQLADICRLILKGEKAPQAGKCLVFPQSVHKIGRSVFFLVFCDSTKYLVVTGGDHTPLFDGQEFSVDGQTVKKCKLSAGNAKSLMKLFPFTAPQSLKDTPFTFGLGDRLGIASPGHIQTIRGSKFKPVLAQQSMRELMLTERTYEDVLANAAFAVFQEDYQGGYGADGDHLKTAAEIKGALNCGYTMITLDCSEKIDNSIASLSQDAVNAAYQAVPETVRIHYEEKYAGKTVFLDSIQKEIKFDVNSLETILLIYYRAIDFAEEIFFGTIKSSGKAVDFELSIDETLVPTDPKAHYIVARELMDRKVEINSLAPRFCGEFQKGIDYIGDANKFEQEYIAHEAIARQLGYKLSIHSGSDKFDIFPIISKISKNGFHIKTSGTSWLEALRVIAALNPALFRRIYGCALENLDHCKTYYHVKTRSSDAPELSKFSDGEIPGLFADESFRQAIHITYGPILNARDKTGGYVLKDEIFDLLSRYQSRYDEALKAHIGKHVELLSK